jgi:hypothetical protein
MRSIAFTAALTASILLSCAGSLSAADAPAACSLVTQDQIAAAFGSGTVGAGSPIFAPTSCQWAGQQGKRVTLTINQPRGAKSPVDQFNEGKSLPVPAVTREPVSGVGDDAYYVYFTGQIRAGCGLVVKNGTGVFEVRVYGFDLDQAKTVSKAIAQAAVSSERTRR